MHRPYQFENAYQLGRIANALEALALATTIQAHIDARNSPAMTDKERQSFKRSLEQMSEIMTQSAKSLDVDWEQYLAERE
jgi:hypothetical protein